MWPAVARISFRPGNRKKCNKLSNGFWKRGTDTNGSPRQWNDQILFRWKWGPLIDFLFSLWIFYDVCITCSWWPERKIVSPKKGFHRKLSVLPKFTPKNGEKSPKFFHRKYFHRNYIHRNYSYQNFLYLM